MYRRLKVLHGWKPGQVTKILQDETMTGATVNNRVQVKGVGSVRRNMSFTTSADSGSTSSLCRSQCRPSLVSEGRIGGIIVKDMSRFGRNYIETGCYIEQVFPLIGIRSHPEGFL